MADRHVQTIRVLLLISRSRLHFSLAPLNCSLIKKLIHRLSKISHDRDSASLKIIRLHKLGGLYGHRLSREEYRTC